jgi:hypothetical protein
MLADEFLPVHDVSDEVATVVTADVHTTWDALMEADLIEVGRQRPLVALLGAIRILPDLVWQRLHGASAGTRAPDAARYDQAAN